MGVGGQLLAVVGELPAEGLALESLLSALNALADKHRVLVSAARAGVRLNLGKLLVQRQEAHGGMADLLQLVFAELLQHRAKLFVGHLDRSLALDDPIVHRMLAHNRARYLVCDYTQ